MHTIQVVHQSVADDAGPGSEVDEVAAIDLIICQNSAYALALKSKASLSN